MKYLKFIVAVSIYLIFTLQAAAQYIYEVLEYLPAPGQHINGSAGTPEAAKSVIGTTTGLISLGAFGGSVTFRFENPVVNNPDHPYGIDFTIFGNSVGEWAEPGIVSVMNDLNRNGVADDTWYELAGSEYASEETNKEYIITYNNPGDSQSADVTWEDNLGNSGFVYANTSHTQSYYPDPELFPSIDSSSYTLSGTRIYNGIDSSDNMLINSPTLGYGYADNHLRGSAPYTIPDNPDTPEIEGAGGDPMDISWAVDHNGNSVELDTIHFIKVHTAVNGHAGILGEISTEIAGAVIVDIAASGISKNQNSSKDPGYKIYPNPVAHRLHISGDGSASIRLVSMTGKLLREWSFKGPATSMDVSGLNDGLYLIQICNEESVFTESFIKR